MRVLVATDTFAGTLTAVLAADAITEGWLQQAPHDEIRRVPMSDGGPGFLDVLHNALGGELLGVHTTDPFGTEVPASVLMVDDVAYIESAQACGRHLTEQYYAAGAPRTGNVEDATTYGVGRLLLTAREEGARSIVVGLGGSGTNDGGAGLLAALGGVGDVDLRRGPSGLAGLSAVDLTPARRRIGGTRIVVATDVDNPLLGLTGATNVYGAQKGVADDRRQLVDSWLDGFAGATSRDLARRRGAGAGGGLGFALMCGWRSGSRGRGRDHSHGDPIPCLMCDHG